MLLEKAPGTDNVYVMDGLEMDKNDFYASVNEQAKSESTDEKDSNGERFKNKYEYMQSLPPLEKLALIKEYAQSVIKGDPASFTLKPIKMKGDNSEARKKLNRVKFNINDANSLQRAINKISKLN